MIEIGGLYVCVVIKKSLNIPKGQSESVYRRRTDNTINWFIKEVIRASYASW